MIIRHRNRWLLALVTAAVLASPAVGVAQEDQAGSKAVNQNAKGPAVAARAPGLMVRDAINGPQIVQSEAEGDAPSRQQRVLIDIINTLFLGLNQLIPFLPAILEPIDGAPTGVGNLVITEVANDGTNTFVEIFNPGSIRIELDNWAFCKLDGCTGPGELAGRVMERDDVLVLQLSGQFDSQFANSVITLQVGTTADDIGLYDFTGAEARDPLDRVALRDYLQWSEFFQSFGLEDVAVSAGLWVTNTSIETLANNSFQLRADRLSLGGVADDYIVVPFAQHSLGQPTPAELESAASSGLTNNEN